MRWKKRHSSIIIISIACSLILLTSCKNDASMNDKNEVQDYNELEIKTNSETDKMDNTDIINGSNITKQVLKLLYKPNEEELNQITKNNISTIESQEVNNDLMSPISRVIEYEKLPDFHLEQINEINLEVNSENTPIIINNRDGYLIGLTKYSTNPNNETNKVELIPIVYKLDFAGNIIWNKEYEPLINGGNMTTLFEYDNGDIGFTMTMYPNVSMGNMNIYGDSGKAVLVRCDSNGKLIWRKNYKDYCGSLFKYAFVDDNQHLITVGETTEVEQTMEVLISSQLKPLESNVILMEINDNGDIINEKIYGGIDFDYCNGATYDSQIGLVISGWSNVNPYGDNSESFLNTNDFIDEKISVTRKYYDFVALFDKDLNLTWVRNSKTDERYYYEQLKIYKDSIYIPGSKNLFNQSNDNSLDGDCTQNTFYEQYNINGELIRKNNTDVTLPGPVSICVLDNEYVVLASGNENRGWLYVYDNKGKEIENILLPYTPNNIIAVDDGEFIIKAIRNIKFIPQPLYISSIWMDSEVVIEQYNKNLEVVWRKTYDDYPDSIKIDSVYPLDHSE